MSNQICNVKLLKSTFKRLQKTTSSFSDLIVRDIFDYVDYEVNLEEYLQNLQNALILKKYKPQKPYYHESPKSKGINRPTAVLDIEDMIVYRYCIETIEKDLLEKVRMNPNIHGGTMLTKNYNEFGDGYYEKWFEDWNEHNINLKTNITDESFVVITDIASYFENINTIVLKDNIRDDVKDKKEVLNLLFFVLENFTNRNGYSVNTHIGLIQESIDCSRLLAYYFLSEVDNDMAKFAVENECLFYRYADDMTIVVEKQLQGKMALKLLTSSLRKVNLVAGIQKTSILTGLEALNEMFINENNEIDNIQSQLESEFISNTITNSTKSYLTRLFKKYRKKGLFDKRNGSKLYKRFMTLFTFCGHEILVSDFQLRIELAPILFADKKFVKYLVSLNDRNVNILVNNIIEYLYSGENLYPQLESNLINSILFVIDRLDQDTKIRTCKFANDLFWSTNYIALSEYAKCLSVLILYQIDDNNDNKRKLVNHYLKGKVDDNILRKYLIAYSLSFNDNRPLSTKVRNKCNRETNESIQRLLTLLDNASIYSTKKVVTDFMKNEKELTLYYNKELGIHYSKTYIDVRGCMLKSLINLNQ